MAKLWIDQTNAKGGLLGRKLKWVEADTKTDRTEGAKAGQSMIDQGAELVFVSCDYDFGAPAGLQGPKGRASITVFICASDPKAGVAGSVGPAVLNNAAQTEGATLANGQSRNGTSKRVYVCSTKASSTTSRSAPVMTGSIRSRAARSSDATSTRTTILRLRRRSRG